MIAQGRTLSFFFASSNAELGGRHEVRPLMQLLQLAIVEYTREDQATDGITVSSCTVRVKLATGITGGDVYRGEVANTRYLDVIRRLNEVSTLDSPCRNDAGSVSRLDTPRDYDFLNIANERARTGFWWPPDTKVFNGVYVDILTSGVLTASCTTLVGASLSSFSLVGQVVWIVGSRVRLSMGAQDEGERDQSNESQTGG